MTTDRDILEQLGRPGSTGILPFWKSREKVLMDLHTEASRERRRQAVESSRLRSAAVNLVVNGWSTQHPCFHDSRLHPWQPPIGFGRSAVPIWDRR